MTYQETELNRKKPLPYSWVSGYILFPDVVYLLDGKGVGGFTIGISYTSIS